MLELGGLKLKNPIMTASGCFGYGEEFARFYDVSRLGAICTKGLSLKPRQGNTPPRIVETAAGMLNSIGLQNVGVEGFLRDKLPWLEAHAVTTIANIFGTTIDEYIELAKRLAGVSGVAAIELNISCPNVTEGGIEFGTDPHAAARICEGIKKVNGGHLMVKLAPNVTDITVMARAVADAGADSISLVNTFRGMAIHSQDLTPILHTHIGGLSGPAIKPMALYLTARVAEAVTIPVIGIGGIVSFEDVREFLAAGAQAIQVGTANFFDPFVAIKLVAAWEGMLAPPRA